MSHIVLFDGICNLCNSSINFIMKRDKKNIYKFISLQSPSGQELLKKHNLPLDDFETFILIENEKYYTASTAALMISKNLSGFVKYLYVFILLPRPIRDFIYKVISKNRYLIFGKKNQCQIPTEDK